jgi:hypothetical protein
LESIIAKKLLIYGEFSDLRFPTGKRLSPSLIVLYKMVGGLNIEFVHSENKIGKGMGVTNEDDEFFDLVANI